MARAHKFGLTKAPPSGGCVRAEKPAYCVCAPATEPNLLCLPCENGCAVDAFRSPALLYLTELCGHTAAYSSNSLANGSETMSLLNTANFNSIQEFKDAMRTATSNSDVAFLLIDDALFMVTPAEAARDSIAENIARRLSENPAILNDIESRLENDQPESWE
jgi:hypothetical protein